MGTRSAQAFCGDLAVIAAEESSAVACRQPGSPGNFRHILKPAKPTRSRSALRPHHDRRPFLLFPPVDGATCYAGAEIDTMKPTRIASLRTQTVTG